MKRNIDKYTDKTKAVLNILLAMQARGYDGSHNCPKMRKAEMGYAAFPDYQFRWPQGAAFAVAKICREMMDDKLIHDYYGYYLAAEGKKFLQVYADSQKGVQNAAG